MDFEKAISSTGELLFEFAASIILIPRTLLKVLRKPLWSIDYLSSQSSERPKARFEKYSNPILFWIVTGVLPYYFIINTYFQGYTEDKVLDAYNGIGAINIVGGIATFLVSFPVSCAFILQVFKYKGFTKTTFKKNFFIQLYITAPVQLFYIPVFFIDQLPNIWVIISGIICFGIIIWFLISELSVIRKELNYNWFSNVGILILMYLIFYVFAGICFLIFFLINMGNFQKLIEATFDRL